MDSSVAYLKGVLADGHVYERNDSLRIVVRQNDKEWLKNVISPILQNLTGKNPKILQTKDGIYTLWVYTNKKHLPNDVVETLLAPLESVDFEKEGDKLSFVKGFFEAEGSIYISKNKANDIRIIMYQKYPQVLTRIRDFLRVYGIPGEIYGPYRNGKNTIYRLIIFHRKNSIKFLEIINPSPLLKYNAKIDFISGKCT